MLRDSRRLAAGAAALGGLLVFLGLPLVSCVCFFFFAGGSSLTGEGDLDDGKVGDSEWMGDGEDSMGFGCCGSRDWCLFDFLEG